MDPASLTASIITILQLTSTAINYLNEIKDASRERARCAIEASNAYNLLVNLRYRLEESTLDSDWYQAVRALTVPNGPLDQYRSALEQLSSKLTAGGGYKKAGIALTWKFSKDEIHSILSRIERLKTLIQVALEMDHL